MKECEVCDKDSSELWGVQVMSGTKSELHYFCSEVCGNIWMGKQKKVVGEVIDE